MEEIRRQLAELMETVEVPREQGKPKRHFRDPEVCKTFLTGLCPHDLFQNTKQYMGKCPKVHSEELREVYLEDRKENDYGYEEEALRVLRQHVDECDRRISRQNAGGRCDSQDKASESIEQSTQREIDALELKIQSKMKEAEELGNSGDVEGSMRAMEEVHRLNSEKKTALREKTVRVEEARAMWFQKLKPCEVCGALLSEKDGDSRLNEHFLGRIHIGFELIRKQVASLADYIKEKQQRFRSVAPPAPSSSPFNSKSYNRPRAESPMARTGSSTTQYHGGRQITPRAADETPRDGYGSEFERYSRRSGPRGGTDRGDNERQSSRSSAADGGVSSNRLGGTASSRNIASRSDRTEEVGGRHSTAGQNRESSPYHRSYYRRGGVDSGNTPVDADATNGDLPISPRYGQHHHYKHHGDQLQQQKPLRQGHHYSHYRQHQSPSQYYYSGAGGSGAADGRHDDYSGRNRSGSGGSGATNNVTYPRHESCQRHSGGYPSSADEDRDPTRRSRSVWRGDDDSDAVAQYGERYSGRRRSTEGTRRSWVDDSREMAHSPPVSEPRLRERRHSRSRSSSPQRRRERDTGRRGATHEDDMPGGEGVADGARTDTERDSGRESDGSTARRRRSRRLSRSSSSCGNQKRSESGTRRHTSMDSLDTEQHSGYHWCAGDRPEGQSYTTQQVAGLDIGTSPPRRVLPETDGHSILSQTTYQRPTRVRGRGNGTLRGAPREYLEEPEEGEVSGSCNAGSARQNNNVSSCGSSLGRRSLASSNSHGMRLSSQQAQRHGFFESPVGQPPHPSLRPCQNIPQLQSPYLRPGTEDESRLESAKRQRLGFGFEVGSAPPRISDGSAASGVEDLLINAGGDTVELAAGGARSSCSYADNDFIEQNDKSDQSPQLSRNHYDKPPITLGSNSSSFNSSRSGEALLERNSS